jgi:hypothetical protein
MPSDMHWFGTELLELMKSTYEAVQAGRHHYSARLVNTMFLLLLCNIGFISLSRFTCQLAITDLNLGELEKQINEVTEPQQSKKVFGPARRREMGISVDIHSHKTHKHAPLSCADELRRYLEADHLAMSNTPIKEEVDYLGPPQVVRKQKEPHWVPNDSSHLHYDSFENCLHIANQMDSILTFYYMEENNSEDVKVTEIFPIGDRMQSPIHQERKPTHEAAEKAFDDFLGQHPAPQSPQKRPALRRCMSEVMTEEYLRANEGISPAKPRCGLPAITEEISSVDSLTQMA